MKRIFVFSLLGVVISSIVFAAFVNDGQVQTNASIAHAKAMKDDKPVQLKGNITQNLGDEKYLFSDGQDTIIVEIDEEDWKGQDVTPNDTVVIIGEMDKDLWGIEIDVDSVQLVK